MSGPTYSEDGQFVWDGNGWVPVAQPQVPINYGVNQYNTMQVNPQPMQVNPQPMQSSNQVVVYSSDNKSGKPVVVVVSIVVGIVLIIVLASVLYVWASSLVEEELEGKWYTEDGDWIEFSSNGDYDCSSSSCELDEWRLGENSGEVALCDDDPGSQGGGCDGSYYYVFEYEVKGDVLFFAPHNDYGDPVSEVCVAMVKSGEPYSSTVNAETSPYWCDV